MRLHNRGARGEDVKPGRVHEVQQSTATCSNDPSGGHQADSHHVNLAKARLAALPPGEAMIIRRFLESLPTPPTAAEQATGSADQAGTPY